MGSRGSTGAGFWAGVLAALLATLAMVFLRLATDIVSLAEMVADLVLLYLPPPIFSAVLDALQFAAKPLLLACVLLGQVLLGGLLGIVYHRLGTGPGWAAGLATLAWLIGTVVVSPLSGNGFFGGAVQEGPVAYSSLLLSICALYAVALERLYRLLGEAGSSASRRTPARLNRRAALSRISLGVGAALSLGLLARFLASQPRSSRGVRPATIPPESGAAPQGPIAGTSIFQSLGMPSEVTPTRDFYVVSKNFIDPAVDRKKWRLKVQGLVDRELELSFDDILAMRSVEQFQTLECISNLVGGDLISNARWKGVPLRELLEEAGVKPQAVDVALFAADDYSDSIPISRALHPGTLLAYEMNGELLPDSHGAPVRLLVPGIYGMKNVKWLTRMQLVDSDFKGYWQQRGWSDVAVYRTMSRLDAPVARTLYVSQETVVGGIAFAGDRGIRSVQVSFDSGDTWEEAEVKEPMGPYTWVLWATRWRPPSPGSYTVKVRAVDGSGDVQTAEVADPLPDGATGLHTVYVKVLG